MGSYICSDPAFLFSLWSNWLGLRGYLFVLSSQFGDLAAVL